MHRDGSRHGTAAAHINGNDSICSVFQGNWNVEMTRQWALDKRQPHRSIGCPRRRCQRRLRLVKVRWTDCYFLPVSAYLQTFQAAEMISVVAAITGRVNVETPSPVSAQLRMHACAVLLTETSYRAFKVGVWYSCEKHHSSSVLR